MGDWSVMIDKAAEFFPVLALPTAIIFGIGLAMWIFDWLFDRFTGGGGYDSEPATGQAHRPPKRLGRFRRSGMRPPTWRDEPYYKTNSWDVLEDRARTVNGYKKGGD